MKERDFFSQPLTEAEAKKLLGSKSAEEVLRKNSPRYRELGLDVKTPTGDELTRLLAREPDLVRRPIIVVSVPA